MERKIAFPSFVLFTLIRFGVNGTIIGLSKIVETLFVSLTADMLNIPSLFYTSRSFRDFSLS